MAPLIIPIAAPEPIIEDYTDYHIGHDIFRGLSRQGGTYEEIDPEFRSLYKRRKKRRK